MTAATTRAKPSAEPKTIKCIALVRIGLGDRTCKVGEEIELPREMVVKLQDERKVKIPI